MPRVPRLIHCHVPDPDPSGNTIHMRVLSTGHLTSVFSKAPINQTEAMNLMIDTGLFGTSRQARDPLPNVLRGIFQNKRMSARRSSNDNRDMATDIVEIGIEWTGAVSLEHARELHGFLSGYALAATAMESAQTPKAGRASYALDRDSVAGFHRLVLRLAARRPWLSIKMTGPWPLFSFPEFWPQDAVK